MNKKFSTLVASMLLVHVQLESTERNSNTDLVKPKSCAETVPTVVASSILATRVENFLFIT